MPGGLRETRCKTHRCHLACSFLSEFIPLRSCSCHEMEQIVKKIFPESMSDSLNPSGQGKDEGGRQSAPTLCHRSVECRHRGIMSWPTWLGMMRACCSRAAYKRMLISLKVCSRILHADVRSTRMPCDQGHSAKLLAPRAC